MVRSNARVQSEHASKYLQQLCKHFAHKVPVAFTGDEGRIDFPIGTCRLNAGPGALILEAEAEDRDRLAQLQDVVDRHLLRFAFREVPAIEWRAQDAPGASQRGGRPAERVNPFGPVRDPKVRAVIERLHGAQHAGGRGGARGGDWSNPHDFAEQGFSISPLQGDLIYLLCRGMGARRVVDFATSVGMSALYFAAAVRDNGGGLVIGSDVVPAKIETARRNLAEAGLESYVELRLGDARETLRDLGGPVDFVLIDGWPVADGPSLAREVIEIVAPQLRVGGYVLNDNAEPDFLDFIRDPANGFISMSLPIKRGTELSLKVR